MWLSGSGFGGEMLWFAAFMKHFSGLLASCRDRPLQITNNVRVQLSNNWRHAASNPQGCLPVATLWEYSLLRGAFVRWKFICSGENILHHHSIEIVTLPEQTSKYNNEHLVRTPNQQYINFFFSDIRLCSRIFWHSRIEWHTSKMELRGRDREV